MKDIAELAAIAEPLFMGLSAEIEVLPAMNAATSRRISAQQCSPRDRHLSVSSFGKARPNRCRDAKRARRLLGALANLAHAGQAKISRRTSADEPRRHLAA